MRKTGGGRVGILLRRHLTELGPFRRSRATSWTQELFTLLNFDGLG